MIYGIASLARLAFVMPVVLASAGAAAQDWPPPAGKPVDMSRTVRLLDAPPTPCVSIPLNTATILLPHAELLQQAREKPSSMQGEEARAVLLERLAARGLLQGLADATDASGCTSLRGAPVADDLRTAGDFLQRGHAYVLSKTTRAPAAQMEVRYLAHDFRGDILFYLPDEKRPFLALSWWVR